MASKKKYLYQDFMPRQTSQNFDIFATSEVLSFVKIRIW